MDSKVATLNLDEGLDDAIRIVAEFANFVEGRLSEPVPELSDVIDRVVVILGSSRGGTSLLYSALLNTGRFASTGGEHTHLYKLAGMLPQSLITGDAVHDANPAQIGAFRRLLSFELDLPQPSSKTQNADVLLRATTRAACQDPRRIQELWDACVSSMRGGLPASAHVGKLGAIVGAAFFDAARTPSPRDGFARGRSVVLEEPPFVRPSVRPALRRPSRPSVLLLKASVDAYRVPLLRKIFHDVPLEIVHLTRNPYAAVNGLIDGWLSPLFHSHRIDSRTQHGEESTWWKFDLPPASSLDDPTPLRSSKQWLQAQRAILETRETLDRFCVVKAEDVMFGNRRSVLGQLLSWLKLEGVDTAWSYDMAPVMATHTPRPFRWKARKHLLYGLLEQSEIGDAMRGLDYSTHEQGSWL